MGGRGATNGWCLKRFEERWLSAISVYVANSFGLSEDYSEVYWEVAATDETAYSHLLTSTDRAARRIARDQKPVNTDCPI